MVGYAWWAQCVHESLAGRAGGSFRLSLLCLWPFRMGMSFSIGFNDLVKCLRVYLQNKINFDIFSFNYFPSSIGAIN